MAQLDITTSAGGAMPSSSVSMGGSDGLTALHLAVLANDVAKVRKLFSDREYGVDQRTATGTTAVMLAALFGRNEIFLYLVRKRASLGKKDNQGLNTLDYVKQMSPLIQDLVRKYKSIAPTKPDGVGRRNIYGVLKALARDRNKAYDQGRADARGEAQVQARAQAQAQLTTPVHLEQSIAQQPSQDSIRTVFLRSVDGKQQEFVEVRQIAAAEHNSNIGRKCTGFIRAMDGSGTHIFAVSGWGGMKGKNVLDNKEYAELVRRVAALLGFELQGNWMDCRFPGSPSEKKGAFVACHSEKQLAVFILIKSLGHVLGTKALTASNITSLKSQLDKLPSELRETTIQLDHESVCRSCVNFLKVLRQKTGLVFRCVSQNWYTHGQRVQIRPETDGSYKQVTEVTRRSNPDGEADIIEDEVDAWDTDSTIECDLQVRAAIQEDDTIVVQDGMVAPPSTPPSRRSCLPRQLVLREPSDNPKRGSPVYEEPDRRDSRYAIFDVTPPSKPQAMPTPQSHHRFTGISEIEVSPNPEGVVSALDSADNIDTTSPSLSQEYEVETVLETKVENGTRSYLVKWRGYPYGNNTWETEDNMTNASEAIRKFWEELHTSRAHT